AVGPAPLQAAPSATSGISVISFVSFIIAFSLLRALFSAELVETLNVSEEESCKGRAVASRSAQAPGYRGVAPEIPRERGGEVPRSLRRTGPGTQWLRWERPLL